MWTPHYVFSSPKLQLYWTYCSLSMLCFFGWHPLLHRWLPLLGIHFSLSPLLCTGKYLLILQDSSQMQSVWNLCICSDRVSYSIFFAPLTFWWNLIYSICCISILLSLSAYIGFPGGSVVNNLLANVGDTDSTPGSERSPGEGNGKPLQYSCLGNSMDRGSWHTAVHGVTKEPDIT